MSGATERLAHERRQKRCPSGSFLMAGKKDVLRDLFFGLP